MNAYIYVLLPPPPVNVQCACVPDGAMSTCHNSQTSCLLMTATTCCSGLIKVENGAVPAPSSSVKAAAPEAAAVVDDKAGTSPKPAAKPVTADSAKKVSLSDAYMLAPHNLAHAHVSVFIAMKCCLAC